MDVQRLITLIGTAVGVPVAIIVALTPLITFLVKRSDERRAAENPKPEEPVVVQGQPIDFAAKTIELYEERIADLEARLAARDGAPTNTNP